MDEETKVWFEFRFPFSNPRVYTVQFCLSLLGWGCLRPVAGLCYAYSTLQQKPNIPCKFKQSPKNSHGLYSHLVSMLKAPLVPEINTWLVQIVV